MLLLRDRLPKYSGTHEDKQVEAALVEQMQKQARIGKFMKKAKGKDREVDSGVTAGPQVSIEPVTAGSQSDMLSPSPGKQKQQGSSWRWSPFKKQKA